MVTFNGFAMSVHYVRGATGDEMLALSEGAKRTWARSRLKTCHGQAAEAPSPFCTSRETSSSQIRRIGWPTAMAPRRGGSQTSPRECRAAPVSRYAPSTYLACRTPPHWESAEDRPGRASRPQERCVYAPQSGRVGATTPRASRSHRVACSARRRKTREKRAMACCSPPSDATSHATATAIAQLHGLDVEVDMQSS